MVLDCENAFKGVLLVNVPMVVVGVALENITFP